MTPSTPSTPMKTNSPPAGKTYVSSNAFKWNSMTTLLCLSSTRTGWTQQTHHNRPNLPSDCRIAEDCTKSRDVQDDIHCKSAPTPHMPNKGGPAHSSKGEVEATTLSPVSPRKTTIAGSGTSRAARHAGGSTPGTGTSGPQLLQDHLAQDLRLFVKLFSPLRMGSSQPRITPSSTSTIPV